MKLTLKRYSDNGDSTLGLLYLDDKFFCYTLEDEKREIKVNGETRIPEGEYDIEFRQVLSGMTGKYREQFSWFTWHLEIKNVPNFQYVYIHKGNTDDHTNGCILVGDKPNNNRVEYGFLGTSTVRFKELYLLISEELEKNNNVKIKIEEI